MSQFQKQSYSNKIMYSPVTLIILLVVVLLAVYGVIDIIPKYADAVKAKSTIEKKKQVLMERQERLEAELDKLKTGEGLEENIREKLDVVKDDEQVIILVDQKIKPSDEIVPKKSWWQRLFD